MVMFIVASRKPSLAAAMSGSLDFDQRCYDVAKPRAKHDLSFVALWAARPHQRVPRYAVMRAIRSVVSAEIAKDLVKLPTKKIEQHVAAIGELG
jgi:hypothetical protein